MTQKKRESTASSKKRDAGEAPGILLQEYNNLVSLYTHSENTLFSIFNFYVTLLTTITGALIVAFQIGERYAANLFFTILILLVFIVLIGIITQDALIHKNGDLAHYALALNAIKSHLLEKHPGARAHVFYMWNLHIRVHPLQYQASLDERLDRRLWWMLPIGMQQLFVSVMDSFALAGMIIETAYKFGAEHVTMPQLILASGAVVVCSYIAHCTYANIKFRDKVKRSAIALDGGVSKWVLRGL